jgi:type II secretory pathway pseudopilin PulG
MILLVLFTIALAVAVPRTAKEIQRDRELETMERGKQFIRAIKLYYKKFGAYPPTVDALVKTSNIRFLRKKYTDPTTGKADWKPIHYGQNQAPTAMGFFGQPLVGSTLAGTGASGGNTATGDSSTASTSLFSLSGSGTSTSSSTASTGTSADSSTSSSTGLSGQTFGGGGIIGFSPNSPKQSILVYKKKNHYNQWEFVYDPLSDQVIQSNSTANIGQSASSLANSSSSTSTTSNSSNSSTTSTTSTTTSQ